MSTVDKALRILGLFGTRQPELRSIEVSRMLDLDRSTCHRMLSTLSSLGYLVKNEETKKYTLGPTILRLAKVHESITPVFDTYDRCANKVADTVGETCHASLITGDTLSSIAACHGPKTNIVRHDTGVSLDWHATASGIACLAFSKPAFTERILKRPLVRHTENTIASRKNLEEELQNVRRRGYSKSLGGLDIEVTGIAVPFFDRDQTAKGAISVVTPNSRLTNDLEQQIVETLVTASLEITDFEAGIPSDAYLNVHQNNQNRSYIMSAER